MRAWKPAAAIAAALSFAGPALAVPVPLLRYGFDDSAATDSVAPAANGTLNAGTTGAGFVTNTPSGTGRAYSTGNGSDGTVDAGYISAGDIAKTDGLTAVTVTAWVNMQGNPFASGTVERIVSDGGVASQGFDLSVIGASAGALNLQAFVRGTTGGTNAASSATVDLSNKWVFIALTYDGAQTTNNAAFFVGGTATAVSQLGSTLTLNGGPMTGGNALGFEVAGTGESGADRTPRAFIDDVRVFDGVADLAFLEGVRAQNVPEPTAAVAMAGAGLALLARRRRRADAATR